MMKKRWLFWLAVICLLMLPSVVWADVTGSYGTVSWVFTDDGTLTFSGSGEIPEVRYWRINNDATNVKKVIINEGITGIRHSAFDGCSSLTSITIPDSVNSIGYAAFVNCNGLISINVNNTNSSYCSVNGILFDKNKTTLLRYPEGKSDSSYSIPESVTIIGADAFWSCNNLTSIIIPESVTSIGDCAFRGCSGLTSITIPDSVTSIGDNVFQMCFDLTNITIPDSVTSIGEYTFDDCSNLANITIPDSITSIGNDAFRGCSNLTSITIPDSVTGIGDYAFESCTNLASINIPNSVINIGAHAFADCTSLVNITIPDNVTSIGDYAFSGCSSLTSITIPDSVTSIGIASFSHCNNLEDITIPNSVTNIGLSAFSYCNLSNVYYGGLETDWNRILIRNENENLTNARIHFSDDTVREPSGTITGSSGTVSWTFTADGTLTFSGTGEIPSRSMWCHGLNKEDIKIVIINNGISSIGFMSFENCSNMKSIAIPDSVTIIGDYAFWLCTSLESINIPDKVTSIGEDAFSNCYGLKSINIPESVTSIKSGTFYTCSSLSNITIPNSVTSIGLAAFQGCGKLENVIIPNVVTDIGERAFAECSSLKNIIIPDKVTNIAKRSFWKCSNLTTVIISDNVTSIAAEAFQDCTSLKEVNIPKKLTSIGEFVFDGCSSLTNITIPDSVTSIENAAFQRCTNLTNITIAKGITQIGEYAFVNCTELKDVYYGGLETDWDNIKIGELNENLTNARIHFSDGTVREPIDKPDEPEAEHPYLKTTRLPGAVQYVPYQYNLDKLAKDGVWLGAYQCEGLPEGWQVYQVDDDTKATYIIGMPTEPGTYTIKLTALASSPDYSGEVTADLTLTVGANTDLNVKGETDKGYELTEINGRDPAEISQVLFTQYTVDPEKWDLDDLRFTSRGEFNEFMECWLDGQKLEEGVDYIAEAGSTKITVRAQTLKKYGVGKHTVVAEFRVGSNPMGELKRSVLNYELRVVTSSGGSSHGGNSKPVEKPVELPKPVEPEQPQMSFADVPEDAWFYEYILWAYTEGLMQGNGDGTFGPNEPTSPAALVAVLSRLAETDLSLYADYVYDDVAEGMWYTYFAKWAKANGLFGDNVFEPDAAFPRGQMAQTLQAYLRLMQVEMPVIEQERQFADSDLMSAEENAAFQTLYALGIFQGNGDNTMNPQGATTRAELAALLQRISSVLPAEVK